MLDPKMMANALDARLLADALEYEKQQHEVTKQTLEQAWMDLHDARHQQDRGRQEETSILNGEAAKTATTSDREKALAILIEEFRGAYGKDLEWALDVAYQALKSPQRELPKFRFTGYAEITERRDGLVFTKPCNISVLAFREAEATAKALNFFGENRTDVPWTVTWVRRDQQGRLPGGEL
jgi:hypothetical protein